MKKKKPDDYITLAPNPRWKEEGFTSIANQAIYDQTLTDQDFRVYCAVQAHHQRH
jgi:hypothetical protein